ncbi:MAG: hypothetical protein KatS3mg065_1051 [Chloroflexota bacterium]|nr:MAG: hypothetical protein KatS3mg065_1051 [Chloroflexota bacterium]
MLGLAARGIWVSVRYADPLLLAVILLGRRRGGRAPPPLTSPHPADRPPMAAPPGRCPRRPSPSGSVPPSPWPSSPTFAPLDRATRAGIVRDRSVAAHLDRAVPVIEGALAGMPGAREPTRGSIAEPVRDPVVLVTGTLLGPRAAVSLDLPASRVGTLAPAPSPGTLRPGQVVYHDRAAVADPAAYRWLELAAPGPIGGVWAEPLLADPSAGVWVLRLSAGPGG